MSVLYFACIRLPYVLTCDCSCCLFQQHKSFASATASKRRVSPTPEGPIDLSVTPQSSPDHSHSPDLSSFQLNGLHAWEEAALLKKTSGIRYRIFQRSRAAVASQDIPIAVSVSVPCHESAPNPTAAPTAAPPRSHIPEPSQIPPPMLPPPSMPTVPTTDEHFGARCSTIPTWQQYITDTCNWDRYNLMQRIKRNSDNKSIDCPACPCEQCPYSRGSLMQQRYMLLCRLHQLNVTLYGEDAVHLDM